MGKKRRVTLDVLILISPLIFPETIEEAKMRETKYTSTLCPTMKWNLRTKEICFRKEDPGKVITLYVALT